MAGFVGAHQYVAARAVSRAPLAILSLSQHTMHRQLIRSVAVAAAMMMTFAAATSAQSVTIGTTSDHKIAGGSGVSESGEFTLGQTFRTPDAEHIQLDAWSFWLEGSDVASTQIQIFEWANNGLLGDALFTSAVVTALSSVFAKTTVEPTGLILDPTKTYLALLNPVTAILTADAVCGPNCGGVDQYSAGQLVQFTTTSSDATDHPTIRLAPADVVFEASFSAPAVTATPEPATVGLLAVGLVGVGGIARRKKEARDRVRNSWTHVLVSRPLNEPRHRPK